MGVKCSDSQLLLLEVGGLIDRTKGKWKCTIPILDEEQTTSLRNISKEIAKSMYSNTKSDFVSLVHTIKEMGFENNALSLVFSYLLDGRMWTKLVLFDEINNHAGWSGCYWVLYEPRKDLKFGTNGFGDMNFILTYLNSEVSPSSKTMDESAEEISKFGKINNPQLISKLIPYGLTNSNGDIQFPIIKKQQDRFHHIIKKLVDSISSELKSNCSIDELPQLFNVLKGDMSIVGNRPLPLYEAELLTSDAYIDRFMAPSGLTGLWQVEKRGGAGKMSAEERKQLDIKYAQEFCFRLDMKILLKTFTAFVQKENV